jgi:hypothetical protein
MTKEWYHVSLGLSHTNTWRNWLQLTIHLSVEEIELRLGRLYFWWHSWS